MRTHWTWLSVVGGLVVALGLTRGPVRGQAPTPVRWVAAELPLGSGESGAAALGTLRATAQALDLLVASGDLHLDSQAPDALVAGRTHERLHQVYRGIPVFGADTTRQLNGFGQTISVFGAYYPDIAVTTTAVVSADEARALIGLSGGAGAIVRAAPTLVVLPTQGTYRLTWMAPVSSRQDGLTHRTFVDAVTGDVLLAYNDTWSQTAAGTAGRGLGLAGDALQVGETPLAAGGFAAIDSTRPGHATVYDLQGEVSRALAMSLGAGSPTAADVAVSADGTWKGAVASAQAYVGLTLDYYQARFGRAGLDNHNLPIRCFVDLARPEDAATVGTTPSLTPFYTGAFYAGDGDIFLGAGALPSPTTAGARSAAAGLDVVSHELSHGVTRFSSNLLYQFEAGALNEAFSDMMSTGVEFMFQPVGTGLAKADWLIGEDVSLGDPWRSLADPHALGAPDHYSLKRIAVLADDNGAVHANASIVNHMYYLAIMGGTNRVSGLTVQGVGFDARAAIETVIYRAFTQMLPANATFAVARAATIQAARDLYGVGSAPEVALLQAWAAVGVS